MPTKDTFVAGFNAHQQLHAGSSEDIRSFQVSTRLKDSRILFAGWSTTISINAVGVQSQGHQRLSHSFHDHGLTEHRFYDAFGDHRGMYGCLGTDGALILVDHLPDENSSDDSHLIMASNDESPRLSHIAMAGNGRVAVTFRQAPRGNLCHVVEFSNVHQFIEWHADPSGVQCQPQRHHMAPGRPKQLCATALSFVMLMEGGEVWSWGDPRHQNLGRALNDQESQPADVPAIVDRLGGLHIVNIACGAWMSAALSQDGALYIWGTQPPGSEKGMKFLDEAGPRGMALVVLCASNETEPLDVQDMSIGDGHLAVETSDHRFFVAGDNHNGQLGLPDVEQVLEDWKELEHMSTVERVLCGPKSTLVNKAVLSTATMTPA